MRLQKTKDDSYTKDVEGCYFVEDHQRELHTTCWCATELDKPLSGLRVRTPLGIYFSRSEPKSKVTKTSGL
jgi:hypothetical protein